MNHHVGDEAATRTATAHMVAVMRSLVTCGPRLATISAARVREQNSLSIQSTLIATLG